MRDSIRRAIEKGIPCLAECGGFLYLHEILQDQNGRDWPMAGIIRGKAFPAGRLTRFGYVEIGRNHDAGQSTAADSWLKVEDKIRGHEFHYWDSTDNGSSCVAVKPDGKRSWNCIHAEENLFAGFPHLYLPSCRQLQRNLWKNAKMSDNSDERGQSPWEKKMELKEQLSKISPADGYSMEMAKERWRTVAKPLYSLGKLEEAVIRMAGMKRKLDFGLDKKALVIMCADNGVVAEKVTQTGQEVTAIVAENFTKGAASVCMMAQVAGADLFPVDIGMASDVAGLTRAQYKIARGTGNMAHGPAMTREQAEQAVLTGMRIVEELADEGMI